VVIQSTGEKQSAIEVPIDSVIKEHDSVVEAIQAAVLGNLSSAHHGEVAAEMSQVIPEILPDMVGLLRDGGHLTAGHRAIIGQSAGRLRGQAVPLVEVTRAVLGVLPHFGRLITVDVRVLNVRACMTLLARFGLIVGECVDAFTRGYSRRGGSASLPGHPIAAEEPVVFEADLSPRERDVLNLVSAGCSNAQVARRLNISVRTVSNYLYRLYPRLGVQSRAGAARWWLTTTGAQA
jgi:DNA-binding CsgD family transcriptional regulator